MRLQEREPLQHPAPKDPSLLNNTSSELQSSVALSMSERKKARKRIKVKRWLRSWVFTPLGNVRIKLINKIERKRCRIVPDCELNRIVFDALNDRYPSRFFRHRSDSQVSSPRRRSLFSDEDNAMLDRFLMSSSSESSQSQSPKLDMDVVNGSLVDRIALAEATTKPPYPDPRGSWRGDGHSALRIMNPDLSVLSSDGKSEESDSISVFEVHRNVFELSAVREMSPGIPAELSGERTQSEQLRSALAEFSFGMASFPAIEDLPPQLPELYFTQHPDPRLCCLITSALRDCTSPALSKNGVCSCADTQQRANPRKSTAEALIRHTYNKRNTILSNWHISPNVIPRPLVIRKACSVIFNNTQSDTLLPIPEDTTHDVTTPLHHRPYSLSRKIQHGPLPPLPPATSTSHLPSISSAPSSSAVKTRSQPPGISATTHSHPASAPPDVPQYPNRPTSMCDGCLAGRHRALHSHPYNHRGDKSPQLENSDLQYQLNPRGPTRLPTHSDSLPSSLRSGPQCRHCRTRGSGTISPPGLVIPQAAHGSRALNRVSISLSDLAPDSPWAGPVGNMGFYAPSEEDLPLRIETDLIDENIDPSGWEMCLSAGSAAQHRRYR
ncbi:uncharacterized protein N7500_007394 [Penicillium coprophilum]|uniref:uncharacterized protein n=1 Tax=Penicillium coprophilum TaxID=36646 RepID=UPI00238A725D|nr:uncharacterized protein N7500_007394 [Penicillium coprophilum]KAJ5165564.1 hypothetical protein N7500_007394 [Penicillium coprophilum]